MTLCRDDDDDDDIDNCLKFSKCLQQKVIENSLNVTAFTEDMQL